MLQDTLEKVGVSSGLFQNPKGLKPPVG